MDGSMRDQRLVFGSKVTSLSVASVSLSRRFASWRRWSLLLLMLILVWPMTALATPSQYCYESACYPTLYEAEADMRAQIAYGEHLELTRTDPGDGGASNAIVYTYVASNQPPVHFYPASYTIGGWGYNTYPGFCQQSADPALPNSCADEAEIAQNMMAYYINQYPDCSFTNIRVEGSYAEPFQYSYSGGGNGGLYFFTADDRSLRFSTWCPGWGVPDPDHRQVQIVKRQTYLCPPGYWPVTGYHPPYNNTGNPDAVAIWPNLCTVGQNFTKIYKVVPDGVKQRPSCPANENPCFPATGDKMRTEPDLEFAGRLFSRYYHSLQEARHSDTVSPGWSYTFLERIGYLWYLNKVYLYGEDGYVQTFSRLESWTFRGDQNAGDRITMENDGTWLMTKADGERRVYSWIGLLEKIISPDSPSRNVALSHDRGNIALAVDGNGRSLRFAYENGLLKSVVDDGGASATYTYDAARNLTQVTYADGSSRSYVYDETGKSPSNFKHLLTGIYDGSQRYATFTYDSQGRANGSMLHAGAGNVAQTSLVYNTDSEVTVTGPLGNVSTYTLSTGAFPQVTGITDASGTRSMSFGGNGRPSGSTDAKGVSSTREFVHTVGLGLIDRSTAAVGEVQQRTQTTVRDGANRISEQAVSTPGGMVAVTRTQYNALGLVQAVCAYDVAVIDPDTYACGSLAAAPAGVRQQAYAYCGQTVTAGCPFEGLLQSVTAAGASASYTYRMADEASCAAAPGTCPYRMGDLWKVTNAMGQVTEILNYDAAGRVLSTRDANGLVIDLEYDLRGRLTARKLRGDNDASELDDLITRIEYWPTGLVKQVTLPDSGFTTYAYDAAHRLVEIEDNVGNRISYTLDHAGNRLQEDTLDTGHVLKRTLSRIYNQLGQLVTLADAQDNPTDLGHDANGNVNIVTDALGRETARDHDPLDRLVRTLQDIGGVDAETGYRYDAMDRLIQVIDPKGLTTQYTYSGLGDLVTLGSPDTGTTTYTYDSAGNRKTQTDARGKTQTYSHDALDRLTGIAYPSAALDVTYAYDASPTICGLGETFGEGRLAAMTDASGSTQYCHDRFGNMVRKVQTTNGQALALRYAYTKSGLVSEITYPDGSLVAYTRNALSQITQVTVTPAGASPQVLLSGATYAPFGPSTGWQYGNGRTLSRSYDQDYRAVSIQDSAVGGLDLGFGYDAVGNLETLGTAAGASPLATLAYDALGRLTHFKDGPTGTPIETYSYDKTGNRTSFANSGGTQAYVYPVDSHRLDSVAGAGRTYDAAGNTTGIGVADAFAYDDAGRMAQALSGAVIKMNYQYNGKGEQVRRHLGSASTYSLYDEAGRWMGDYDDSGAPKQQVIWLDDAPVGLLVGPATASERLKYIQPDHLGTPRAVIDPIRSVAIWTWPLTSEAFGNSPPNEDPDGDSVDFVFDMRFPGQRYDAASGLNYNYFRDYDPATGRYVQSDPIGLLGGISTYGYVGGAPTIASDPLGLECRTTYGLFVNVITCDPPLMYSGNGRSSRGRYTPDEQSMIARYCPGENKCEELKVSIRNHLSVAEGQIQAMRNDRSLRRLYELAFSVPNQEVTGTRTTWQNHREKTAALLERIRKMIDFGQKLGCEMSFEYARYIMLEVPYAPE